MGIKLQKREKTLLVVLLIIAIFGLFTMYVVLPQKTALDAARQELSSAQMELSNKQIDAAMLAQTQAEYDQALSDSEALYSRLTEGKAYDIGLLLSNKLLSFGLMPLNMNISERSRSSLIDSYFEDPASIDGYAYMRTVSMSFLGTRTDADLFINDLTNMDICYVITGITTDLSTHGAVTNVAEDGTTTIVEPLAEFSVSLNMYEFVDTRG